MKTALVLRVCAADGSSTHGFKWPLDVGAVVKAPDWTTEAECGHGLHGWLYGQGDHSCTELWANAGALWLVLEVAHETMIDLGGKVKFPDAIVRFAGDKKSATDYLYENEPRSRDVAVIGAQRADLRDKAMVQVGVLGTATAGALGAATAGHGGTATAGHGGTATAGDSGTATAGALGTATAGYGGTATAGYSGTATAGYRGAATAGYGGTATAGYRGAATAGDSGAATAGYGGTATAGADGVISIEYYDGSKYRRKIGQVGENGLKPNVAYRIENGNFVEAK